MVLTSAGCVKVATVDGLVFDCSVFGLFFICIPLMLGIVKTLVSWFCQSVRLALRFKHSLKRFSLGKEQGLSRICWSD